jgi:hypothetical protein
VHLVRSVSLWFTGGLIVLDGFVGKLLRSEPGSAQEERINQQMVFLSVGTA